MSKAHRLSPEDLEHIHGMTRAQRSRYLGPFKANARLAARMYDVDHIARRPLLRQRYSAEHYRNLLRCPGVVFAKYGSGLV